MTSNGSSIGLNEAYSVKTPEDVRALYAKWAATYESEFVEARKYRYPRAIAEVFDQKVPHQNMNTVIDIGTGTGLTGTFLTALRPNLVIDGIDISREMLSEASKKKRPDGKLAYRDLYERDLTKQVDTDGQPYDGLISSGTFTHGHLGPEIIAKLIPLIRPNGFAVIGVNNEHFVQREFANVLQQLVNNKIITEPEIIKIDVYEVGSPHHGDQAQVLIFQSK